MFEVDSLARDSGRIASTPRTFDRLNPLTGTVATRAAAATVEDATAAAASAAAAFRSWSAVGPSDRRGRLMAAAGALEAHEGEFPGGHGRGAWRDLGGSWSRFNVSLGAGMLREAAAMTTAVRGEAIPSTVPGATAFSVRQPVGVVLSMAPWNAPVILGMRSIAMPLSCGNTVVFKASEICPRTHWLIGEDISRCGFRGGSRQRRQQRAC